MRVTNNINEVLFYFRVPASCDSVKREQQKNGAAK